LECKYIAFSLREKIKTFYFNKKMLEAVSMAACHSNRTNVCTVSKKDVFLPLFKIKGYDIN